MLAHSPSGRQNTRLFSRTARRHHRSSRGILLESVASDTIILLIRGPAKGKGRVCQL